MLANSRGIGKSAGWRTTRMLNEDIRLIRTLHKRDFGLHFWSLLFDFNLPSPKIILLPFL